MNKDKCIKGQSCGYSCISKNKKCRQKELAQTTNKKLSELGRKKEFNFNEVLAEGYYGKVLIDRENSVVQKIPKRSKFDLQEIAIGYIMGEMGFGPKVYKELSDENRITMDLYSGKTAVDEVFFDRKISKEASGKLFDGLYFLQKDLKMYHKDLHSENVLIRKDGSSGIILDFGLAQKITTSEKDLEIGLADWSDMADFAIIPDTKKYKEISSLANEYSKLEEDSKDIDEVHYKRLKKSLLKRYSDWLYS